ncbi:hypothetical protein CFIMG_001823RA [Ceratocystis fimbriata CBS 114723]|uniref:Cysteine-rich transmembrane CYSTM domain-containing protein n=1 Tax=Ceratocystis fimbriata CBS 114723 TaxID=1035309 RepID=A0A2C5X5F8_9PEZI|nr:hypothetical protein CFIMG_001823RA [Ceratocystis fimbriata CBS 114723]
MPVVEQQIQPQPIPMVPTAQGEAETQQPRAQDPMSTSPSRLRGGGEGGGICCGICAGLACFECCECMEDCC